MDITAFLEVLRSDYLREFEAAYYQQVVLYENVYPEIALEFSGPTYKQRFVVDLLGQNGQANNVIEVGISDAAYGGDRLFQYKDLSVDFGRVSWDSMIFSYQPIAVELLGFEGWFDKWIDLDGARFVEGRLISDVIHSSRLEPGLVEVDFGSASTDAVVELLDLFLKSGVEAVLVSSGRD